MKFYPIFRKSEKGESLFRIVTNKKDAVQQTKFFKSLELEPKPDYIAYETDKERWLMKLEPYCKNGEII